MSPEMRVHRTLATVWSGYDFHFDDRLSHCGVDAVQLHATFVAVCEGVKLPIHRTTTRD